MSELYYCPQCGINNMLFGSGKCVGCLDEHGNPYVDLVLMPMKIIDDELYREHVEVKEDFKIVRTQREEELLDLLNKVYVLGDCTEILRSIINNEVTQVLKQYGKIKN